MTMTIEAVVEAGVLRPLAPLDLADGTRVTATLTEERTDAAYLLTLPRAERRRRLQIAAALAAPLYEADLALPESERELTTFESLREPTIEDDAHGG